MSLINVIYIVINSYVYETDKITFRIIRINGNKCSDNNNNKKENSLDIFFKFQTFLPIRYNKSIKFNHHDEKDSRT